MEDAKHEHRFTRSDKDCRPDLLVMVCGCGEVKLTQLPAPHRGPEPVIIPLPWRDDRPSPRPYDPWSPSRPRPYWAPHIIWESPRRPLEITGQ